MAKLNQTIHKLCREINHEADDRKKLQTLVIKLQAVLREERCERGTVKIATATENPFDKIMV